MNLNKITKRRAVYEAILSPVLQTTWRQAVAEAPVNANYNNMNLLDFASAREQFVLKGSDCTRTLAEDIRYWLLYDLKKPRNMTVHDFQGRVNEICEYFPHMPRPRDTIPVTPRIATPNDNDKIAILHNACPRSWKDEHARTNQLDLDLQHLLSYYSTLKNIEQEDDQDDGERMRRRKKLEKRKKE